MSDRLQDSMNRLAESCAQLEAPPEIERAVLAEFDRVRRHRRIVSWTVKAGALAAALVVVIAMPWQSKPAAPTSQVAEAEEPFIAIPYVAPLASYERADVVRMQLPVAALIAAGLPVQSADPGAHVEAEVLVGQDGRARAVRLISAN